MSAWDLLVEAVDDSDDATWDRIWRTVSSRFSEDEAEKIWKDLQRYDADEAEEYVRELEKTDASGGIPPEMIVYPPGGTTVVPVPEGDRQGLQSATKTLKLVGKYMRDELDQLIDTWDQHQGKSWISDLEKRIDERSAIVKMWPGLVGRFRAGAPTRDDLNVLAYLAEDDHRPSSVRGMISKRIGPYAVALLRGTAGQPIQSPKQDYAAKEQEVMDFVRQRGSVSRGELGRKISSVYGRAKSPSGSGVNMGVYGTMGRWLDKGKLTLNQDGTVSIGDRTSRPKELVTGLLRDLGMTLDSPNDKNLKRPNFEWAENAVGKPALARAIRSWPRFRELLDFVRDQRSKYSSRWTPGVSPFLYAIESGLVHLGLLEEPGGSP